MDENKNKLIYCAIRIAFFLRVGEVNYAYSLYPEFISLLQSMLKEDEVIRVERLLQEMLVSQENNNTVWLADLVEYTLVPFLKG